MVWSTRRVAATRLTGTDGHLELTLEGLSFSRTKSGASSRGTARLHQVEWSDVVGAEVTQSRKGRPVVRIVLRDVPAGARHQEDPNVLKLKRQYADDAHAFVKLVNEEVSVRASWRTEAETD